MRHPVCSAGRAGATGEVSLEDGTRLHAKALMDLKVGDVVHIDLPGGGGYGDPLKRDIEKVRWDVIDGYITAEDAESKYGVMVTYNGKADDLGQAAGEMGHRSVRTTELRRRDGNSKDRLRVMRHSVRDDRDVGLL